MGIPLDYYRILGVPIQATDEQVSQAYRDRADQLPRREYSELAIKARKQLLDEAYEILSDSERRSEYNAKFLEQAEQLETNDELQKELVVAKKTPKTDPNSLLIKISVEQFPGAMLILQELGEYEQVLQLAPPYLSDLKNNKTAGIDNVKEQQLANDVILTMALATLELGREKWQQQEYENAASSLQIGLDLLLQSEKFTSIQEEITADLYKLRPYRILDLLDNTKGEERRLGLHLLKEMLAQRQGIDGKGEDHSGLNIDDFLRFIQQIRSYLTVAEQQELFEVEAERPSAVGTYLAVYALLARGFVEKQPALIVRGQEMLRQLGKCQDVYLEESICALLLGQTAECSELLQKSKEQEALTFIRKNSQGSPDLLPGLCLYTERWLTTEVFKHFRDLAKEQASLKKYFAERQVQIYLEKLAGETSSQSHFVTEKQQSEKTTERENYPTLFFQKSKNTSNEQSPNKNPEQYAYDQFSQQDVSVKSAENNTNLTSPVGSFALSNTQEENRKEYKKNFVETKSYRKSDKSESRRRKSGRRQGNVLRTTSKIDQQIPMSKRSNVRKRRSSKATLSNQTKRIVFLGLMLLAFLLLLRGIMNVFKREEGLLIGLNQPPLEIPQPEIQPEVSSAVENPENTESINELNNEIAVQVITNWLSTKSRALGSEGKVEELKSVLAQPILVRWESLGKAMKESNSYWQYEHPLIEVRAVKINEGEPTKATVEAKVREIGNYYENGQLNPAKFYDSSLVLSYKLVYKEGWLIENIDILERL
ncbi:MAG: DUF4101 domain-containing protein [Gomphosphaeria aponina SAG 52.96 = DSM 107014]|uniref:DUF4101 domain-containing protein n=1 Tax=Gomphosphaeria aponina SAG 52.96 = DSM 107014 TaxID=1521640 RepID=A0A941GPA5_9CHRO|nr:DUF4101 domain-containing protein [Gomphosphaeria aponina SAG 52.96 = DSM 107014]